MGGKRQANILSALITNFDTVEAAIEASENSAGSALRENAVFMDSLEGRMQQLTNTVQKKWQEALDTDLIKEAIHLITQLVDSIDFDDSVLVGLVDLLSIVANAIQGSIFGFKNLGNTLVAFFSAKALNQLGVTDWLTKLRSTSKQTVESITKDIEATKARISTRTELASRQSGTAQKSTLQKIAADEKLLKKLEEDKKALLQTMTPTERELIEVAEGFDVTKVQRQINGKKGAIAKRTNKLKAEKLTPEQIQSDAKIKQWNQEIEEGQKKIDLYNEKLKEANSTLNQTGDTMKQASGAQKAKSSATNSDTTTTGANTGAQAANQNARQGATSATVQQGAAIDSNTASLQGENAALTQNTSKWKSWAANAKTALGSFAKGALQTIGMMLAIQGILGLLDNVTEAIKNARKDDDPTFEDLHNTFEEMTDDLSEATSKLNSLESELDNVSSQILEIQSLGEISFTKEEELNQLKTRREELERQLEIQEQLAKGQQIKTNAAALDAAKAYMKEASSIDESREEFIEKETENVTKWTDSVGDLLMGAGAIMAVVPAIGWVAGAITAGVGAVTKFGGALIAQYSAEQKYDKQQTNKQAINNYAAKKDDYKKRMEAAYAAGDAEEYNKIKEESDKFESMMSDNIGEIVNYLNSVDYKTLSDTQKEQFEEFQRIVNQYSLKNGGSIVNVINSILKYDRYQKTGYDIDQIQEKLKRGEITEEEAANQIQEILDASPQLKAEFTSLGIKIDDVIKSYIVLGTTMKEDDSVTNSIDKISKVTNAFDELGNAIKEFREDGAVSVGTLEGLNEIFGSLDEFDELYKVLATGEGNLTAAVTSVANAYIGQAGILSDLTDEELDIMEKRLTALGVLNAKEVILAKKNGQQYLAEYLKNRGYAYSIDLGNYGTAEEAKLAIAQAAGLKIADITDDNIQALADQYGVDLKNYATTEEAKIAIAQARANAEADADMKALQRKYESGEIDEYEYRAGINAISDAVNFTDLYPTIQQIINNAYKDFEFDFSGRTGIGSEFDEVSSAWEKKVKEFENRLALITNERNLIQVEVDLAEARGGQASKEMYDDLIRSQIEEKQLLLDKKAALEEYLEKHKDSIDPDTWTEYNNAINETAVAIKECEVNIIDYAKALRDVDMHYFEQALDEISRLGEEIEFVMSLFEDDDMFDEDGNWTDAGIAKINLLRDLMTTAAAEAEMWQNRMTDLNSMEVDSTTGLYKFDKSTKDAIAADFQAMLDTGAISQETYDTYMTQLEDAFAAGGFSKELWTEWHNEAEDGYRNAISAGKDAQDQMIEMNDARIDAIEEGINKEIEAYEEYINVLKESLDAERDLYDFKKNVKKQSKDIASLERRIAALSGSTNAADIAERRRLETDLFEAKESLNDTYYDHASEQQSNALDKEAEAFSKAKEKYVETMREAAEDSESVINDMILNGIFNADVANEFLNRIEETYNIPLSEKLTTPWDKAAEQAISFKNQVGIVAGENIPASVTMISDSIIQKLGTDGKENPWNKALSMADKYADFLTTNEFSLDSKDLTTFEGQISKIVQGWNNVKTAADNAYDAQVRVATVGGNSTIGNESDNDDSTKTPTETVTMRHSGSADSNSYVDKNAPTIIDALNDVYYPVKGRTGFYVREGSFYSKTGWINEGSYLWKVDKKYAKGTIGTKRNEWALTDELGDELVLVPGANGNLSFMRKGTSVVPADITANLVEWGKLNPDMLKVGGGANINMINNAVNKPEIKLDIGEFLHVDNVDKNAMPELEKFVDRKMNDLVRQLNYSIKKFK